MACETTRKAPVARKEGLHMLKLYVHSLRFSGAVPFGSCCTAGRHDQSTSSLGLTEMIVGLAALKDSSFL